VRLYVRPNAREESRCNRHRNHHHECVFHLVRKTSPLVLTNPRFARANKHYRTPYLWPKSDAPRYIIALTSSAAFSIATFLLAWLAKILFMRRNKKLREESDEVQTFFVY
jgi:hypothetical protein